MAFRPSATSLLQSAALARLAASALILIPLWLAIYWAVILP
jgi:hypothetical protein